MSHAISKAKGAHAQGVYIYTPIYKYGGHSVFGATSAHMFILIAIASHFQAFPNMLLLDTVLTSQCMIWYLYFFGCIQIGKCTCTLFKCIRYTSVCALHRAFLPTSTPYGCPFCSPRSLFASPTAII